MRSEPPKDKYKTEEVHATLSGAVTPPTAVVAAPQTTSSSRDKDYNDRYYSRFRRY